MTVTPIFEYLSPCKTLAKNAVAFCPCLKNNFPGAKLKSNELISLAEEILRQSYIDSVMWLFTLMQFYNEKRASGVKRNAKHTVCKVKRAPGNLMLETRLVLKEIRGLARGLTRNEIKKWVPQARPPPS